MLALVLFLVLGGLIAWVLWDGTRRQASRPDYPRQRQLMMIQAMGEEFGWWAHVDTFGCMPPRDWLPSEPAPPQPSVLQYDEQTARLATYQREKTKVEEIILGG